MKPDRRIGTGHRAAPPPPAPPVPPTPDAQRRQWLATWLLAAPALAHSAAKPPALGDPSATGPSGSAVGAAGPDPGDARPALLSSAIPDAFDNGVSSDRRLQFPRDHGAHRGTAIEWWYATGWLVEGEAPAGRAGSPGPDAGRTAPQPRFGFQVTFFRWRTAVNTQPRSASDGRFSPRHLLFAHAALTDLAATDPAQVHRHAQRLGRWSGDTALTGTGAATADTAVQIGSWRLQRGGDAGNGLAGAYRVRLAAPDEGLGLALLLQPTQPRLLQGQAGFSRKGPEPTQASHYYTQPQLAVSGSLSVNGRRLAVHGRGWLDHEWSDALLAADAVGWDWMGINLFSGAALTAFALRRADGSVLWTGGSFRRPGEPVQDFGPAPLALTPLRTWTSPSTGGRYPVVWAVDSPVGRFTLQALADAQELDSRASTGTVYWEGLAELLDASGQRVGLGYLEMTGRVGRLRLGG